MKKTYTGVRGTSDFSPREAAFLNHIVQTARNIFKIFGYEEIILPVLEEEGVFSRGVGETSDIVEKQMFKIARRSEEASSDIVLRPEGTAQVVRYYLENSLHKQSDFYKFCYIGPMFRGERPQKGRLRQFHHIGAEAIGSDSPYIDAEMINLAMRILGGVGVSQKELKINSLGCAQDKQKFSKDLKEKLTERKNELCPDCLRRLEKNPLRVLDCKEESCKRVVASLKLGTAHLCDSCKKQFNEVCRILTDLGISYIHEPYLVRGLDYYTNTVFEIISKGIGSCDAIGAGGRYNALINDLGGPAIPALGFALGIERVMLALSSPQASEKLDVFIANLGEAATAAGFKLLEEMRNEKIPADMDYCSKSLKAQLRYAQRLGVRFVAIIGEEELKEGVVVLKDMGASTQVKVKKEEFIVELKKQAQH
ncbi:MAG: histidine--tRNA ligase [Candidatus Omnitrophica bacterium]|nr:histidine--tRNA ligase [Candidatus Omnitrophota bacterium]